MPTETGEHETRSAGVVGRLITTGLLVAPPMTAATMLLLGHGPSWAAVLVGGIIGWIALHGIAIGYHRYLTHRSFTTGAALRTILAWLGTGAVQGGPIGWVATHRVHHRTTDRTGDPHSPVQGRVTARGLLHAHVGWLLGPPQIDPAAVCPDLLNDHHIRRVDRLWPLGAITSVLVLPFLAGWTLSGMHGAVNVLLWGGVVRMGVVHHLTWTVNSIGHAFGKQPFPTKDGSRNVAVLAPFTCGEGWHNAHHAYPRMARHGMLPGQIDTAARVIRTLELVGLVTDVRWPDRQKMREIARRTTPPSVTDRGAAA